MPERLTTLTIDRAQCQALIAELPCFSQFNSAEITKLVEFMYEVHYAAGETIVEQDALVDKIFVIIEGQAEVTREFVKKSRITKKTTLIKSPVAILNPGEAIGLNDTGFYSSTGKRTATVVALTPMRMLCLELKQMQQFFQEFPQLQTTMYAATEQMLRMHLIKQSLPFSRLSHERLQWLAHQIEEISLPPGSVIFKQGEIGDSCFLVRSGQVEIVADEGGKKHQLAILKPPTLFGEATMITRDPRNASAIALEETHLLVLKHQYLTELIESESKVADMFMNLMVDRSRPLRNANVGVHHRVTADNQEIVILKNSDNGNYFKLSSEGWFVWQQLDGSQTMQEITLDLANKFNIFAPDVVAGLISKLAKGGFITNLTVDESNKMSDQPRWVRFMLKMRRILEARVAIGDADQWLTPLYNKGGRYLFTLPGKCILAVIVLSGLVSFGLLTPHILHLFEKIHASLLLFLLLVPFTLISVVIHELGHALATKAFGFEVHYMGVGWYWLGPVAFTDTSDMWLGTRWPRVFVNLAGVMADMLTAGITTLIIFVVPNPYVQCFLWIFALYTYINAFRMLSPLQDLDGYYVLMDLFDKPRLRRSAVVWLVKEFPKALRKPSLLRKNLPAVWYWMACIVFLVIVSVLTLLVQGFVFKIIGIHANPLVNLVLPFLVVVISSLGIIADIRSQTD